MGIPTMPYFVWPADRNGDDADQIMMMRKTENKKKKKKRNKYSGSAAEKKNKQPQRGLGVAQLEKLRLQERWKKMTCTPYPSSSSTTSSGLFYGGVTGIGGGDVFGCTNSTPVGYLPMQDWLGNQRSHMMINNIIPCIQSSPSSPTPTAAETTFWRNYNPFLPGPSELSSNQKNITHHRQYNHYADSCNLKVMGRKKKETVVREYQLFPCGNTGSESDIETSNQHDDIGERSNYASSKQNTPIDLTLKLNSY